MSDFNHLTKSEEFRKWFWQVNGTKMNGADIIRYLNDAQTGTKKVRYEEHGPIIYGIKLEGLELKIETDEGYEEMLLLKVGFTQMDTSSENKNSRINLLKDEIKSKMEREWKGVTVDCVPLFVLSIDALDTRGFFDVEDDVRSNYCGLALPKSVGKALGLPVHTEWVVGTVDYWKCIRQRINKLKKNKIPVKQGQKPPYMDAARASGGQGADDLNASMHNMTLEETMKEGMIDTMNVFNEEIKEKYKEFSQKYSGVSDTFKVIEKYKHDQIKVTLNGTTFRLEKSEKE